MIGGEGLISKEIIDMTLGRFCILMHATERLCKMRIAFIIRAVLRGAYFGHKNDKRNSPYFLRDSIR